MLFVIGLGINAQAHISREAKQLIEQAKHIYYLLSDSNTENWLTEHNKHTTDLSIHYRPGINRLQIYQGIVNHVIAEVSNEAMSGEHVCVVFYGHPSVFVNPGLEIVRQARAHGIYAKLLPGISADACLYADLEFDPSNAGCQMYEATDFLHRNIRWETAANLILWQIGVVDHFTSPEDEISNEGLNRLVTKLLDHYPADHNVVIYEAAFHIFQRPRIEHTPLAELPNAELSSISTLYIPPKVA